MSEALSGKDVSDDCILGDPADHSLYRAEYLFIEKNDESAADTVIHYNDAVHSVDFLNYSVFHGV